MSKLKEDAARFITEAGRSTRPEEIQCVSGYNKRIDCYRFEIIQRDFVGGCWLTLSEFVRECKRYGAAELVRDGPHWEIYPKYPPGASADTDPNEADFMAALGPRGK